MDSSSASVVVHTLPEHLDGHSRCPCRETGEIEEDVGLVTTACPACGARFVFLFKQTTWQSEAEFEANLRDHPPIIKGI
jgi:hypothetical protein